MRRLTAQRLAVLMGAALLAASCGSDSDESEPTPTPSSTTTTAAAPTTAPGDDPEGFAGTIELTLDQDPTCELIGHECLLPFPSDALTVDDSTSATGRRVALPASW